jgi:hypothetical protein
VVMAIATLVHKFSYTTWHRCFFALEAVGYFHCFWSRITQASVGNTMSIFRVRIGFFKQFVTLAHRGKLFLKMNPSSTSVPAAWGDPFGLRDQYLRLAPPSRTKSSP